MGRSASMSRHRVYKVVGLVLTLLSTAGLGFYISLPDRLFNVPYSTVLYAADGTLLSARVAKDEQWRFPARGGNALPSRYVAALLLYEDKRYFQHMGVDLVAMARALEQNAAAGKIVSGGSTLTMQVIRLSRGQRSRTYWQKWVESVLALRLEWRLSKQEILALYSAHAPFGGNVVGLDAASWRYLGRSPDDLSWAEATLLAILPNQPAVMHLSKNRDKLKQKRDHLLARLRRSGKLTSMEYRLAKAEPLPPRPSSMPHWADHLLSTIMMNSKGAQDLRSGSIVTTLDSELQKYVHGTVSRHGEQNEQHFIHNAAALVIDNSTRKVVAYVGNAVHGSHREHGRSIDLVRRHRSSGSILKPLLFAFMLDAGHITPDTLVYDVPTFYRGYAPQNFDKTFRGAVKARDVLTGSLNVPSVRMLHYYGIGRFYQMLKDVGVSSLFRPVDDYGLSLILGGAEVSLWDITRIYARLAFVLEHPDQKSLPSLAYTIARESDFSPALISPGSAWLTLNALLGLVRPQGYDGWQQFNNQRPIAWKTGTSYGSKDAWAIGVTRRYTVGVWVGNANGQGRPEILGVSRAAPMMFDIFSGLMESPWFHAPVNALKPVTLCQNDGFLANAHCQTKQQYLPANSHFQRLTPHNVLLPLDRHGRYQVNTHCEPSAQIVMRPWFQLPSTVAYFYQKNTVGYKVAPPFKPGCKPFIDTMAPNELSLIYPPPDARLYIPRQLDGQKGRLVFRASHKNSVSIIYWHLDETYLGQTKTFHEMPIQTGPGAHTMTLVDQNGVTIQQKFYILNEEGERPYASLQD